MYSDIKGRSRLSVRVVVVVLLCSSLLTLLTTAFQLYFDYQKDVESIHSNISLIKNSYLPAIISTVYTLDVEQVEILLEGSLNLIDIEYIAIEGASKNLFKPAGNPAASKDVTSVFPLSFTSPSGKIISLGTLKVSASLEGVYQRLLEKTFVILLSNMAKTFVAAILYLIIINHFVFRHLGTISNFTSHLNLSELGQELTLDRKVSGAANSDELDQVVSSLNDMQAKIRDYISKREQAEENLRESEEEFRNLFENTPVSSWLEDFSGVKIHFDALREEGVSDIEAYFREHPEELQRCAERIKIKDVNQATLDLHQAKSKEQLLQGLETTFTPESLVVFKTEMIDVWNGKNQAAYDTVVRTFNDEVRYVTVSYKVAPGHEESLDKVLVTLVDITEKTLADKQNIKLETQLQQSQKMEAIGTLAGGIAHDFNNILAAILGYAEMARDDCQPQSTVAKDLDKVLEGGNRAKDLVQQILAFSRQSEMEQIPLEPVSVVKEAIKMLRPSLPTTIEINQDITSNTGQILADPTQIHQILMNLCTNAFHAMEDNGGKLDISLKEVHFSAEDLVHEPDVEAGTFVQLSISDSGPGIPPDIKKKIFDPYFTTKETGKGTGMGLAIVHGIVKSYGGILTLYSELGEGTAFHVFLPVIEKESLPEIEDVEPTPVGRERILFIDDEEILAEMGKSMLERLGYHVTVRNKSIEALETFKNQPDLFDLVITDQTMPGMTGADIARRMIQIRPDIPIILCTGYSTVISEEKAKSFGIKEFALKPLSKKDIAVLIRKVLDSS